MYRSNFFRPWCYHPTHLECYFFLAYNKAWHDTHVTPYAKGNLMAKVAEYFHLIAEIGLVSGLLQY